MGIDVNFITTSNGFNKSNYGKIVMLNVVYLFVF
jgi:hypothetical protein